MKDETKTTREALFKKQMELKEVRKKAHDVWVERYRSIKDWYHEQGKYPTHTFISMETTHVVKDSSAYIDLQQQAKRLRQEIRVLQGNELRARRATNVRKL